AASTAAELENGFACAAAGTEETTMSVVAVSVTFESLDIAGPPERDRRGDWQSRSPRRNEQLSAALLHDLYYLYHSATTPWPEHAPCLVAALEYVPSLHLPEASAGLDAVVVFAGDLLAPPAASFFGVALDADFVGDAEASAALVGVVFAGAALVSAALPAGA